MTNTINVLVELHRNVKELVSEINWRDYLSLKVGQEEEYTCKSLMAGLSALLADLGVLVNSPSKFVKVSTYGERKSIAAIMSTLKQGLVEKNFTTIAITIRLVGERTSEIQKKVRMKSISRKSKVLRK